MLQTANTHEQPVLTRLLRAPGLTVARLTTPGFHDIEYDGRSWRVFVARPEGAHGRTVQIFQSGLDGQSLLS